MGKSATTRNVVAVAGVTPANAGAFGARSVTGREVGLDTDDWLDSGLFGRLVEVVGSEKVAVVGDRECGHPRCGCRFNQWLNSRRSIEHRILGVHM